jgi:arylsulfatase A-like enzyme
VLERYAVHNPSFLFADSLVRSRPMAPSFDRFLRAHTGLTDISVSPISIDLVPALTPSAAAPPLIFLLVIDSLRSDYLSPYNPAVGFTPRIQEFASDNLQFTNTFTRYGGTGLSMPAIWAGSAIIHKQYVHPFAPMNALEKLLDVNGYQKIMSRDHITAELWTSPRPIVELDHGRTEMDFDFCGTLDELGGMVRAHAADTAPIFAQTRSLNLHVAAVRNGYVPPGKSYPGFEPPYAWRIERMDACFGKFIDLLKQLHLYERSLVVLTADHGELIGEDGRWGHSYHMFPEVIQIPLLMHLPTTITPGGIDRHAISLSTDITPTLYAALGYHPVAVNDLMGRSLIESDDAASATRRRGQDVLAASYGAVYAVVSRNGHRLYIADAIKGGDYTYQRHAGKKWTPVDVEPGTRAVGQLQIRRYVDELSRLYHVERAF